MYLHYYLRCYVRMIKRIYPYGSRRGEPRPQGWLERLCVVYI